jgi:hypothetical protein
MKNITIKQMSITEERINEALQMISGAREDVENHWEGNKHAREAIDLQLSVAQSRIDILQNFINLEISQARHEGRMAGLDRGLEIHNETYGSLKDQLQAGEGNTQP